MKQSLGLSTIQELDLELAKRFKRTVPIEKLNNLLKDDLIEQKPIIEDLLTGDLTTDQLASNKSTDKPINETLLNKSTNKLVNKPKKPPIVKYVEHEHPTLLHFAAEFNLKAFASSLLEFEPNSELCFIKNCHGLTPLAIAKLNEYNEISRLIKQSTEKYSTEESHLTETEAKLICDLDYVNMSTIKLPKNENEQKTSDFTTTDSSDQSSIDGVDVVDGLILKNKTESNNNQFLGDYDFIRKPIKLGKLIDLDSFSTGEENTSGDDDKSQNDKLLLPPKSNKSICSMKIDETKKENYDYDVVKSSPRRTNLIDSPIRQNLSDQLSSSFNKPNECKSNLFERFNELRVSLSSSESGRSEGSNTVAVNNSIDLQTSNLTESQIELLNIIKAFKMGCYTNDEVEVKFKQWATKYKYKIDHNNRFEKDSSLPMNRMGKRSVSSSHLLSQDVKLDSKDSGCSSRSSTIKTCLSNINLNAIGSSPSKFGKQFSLTDWFHTLTAKLKQTKNDKDELTHKSSKFEKYEKKVKSLIKRWV